MLLQRLRSWWRIANAQGRMLPGGWLFPGLDPTDPLTPRQLNRAVHAAAKADGIDKRISTHSLRHRFATQLLERKVYIRVIQVLLGHKRLALKGFFAPLLAQLVMLAEAFATATGRRKTGMSRPA